MPSSRAPLRVLRRRLTVLWTAAAALVMAAGGGFAAVESHLVSGYWQGVWWALSLMTTVGFVGESPETVSGRVLSAVLMVAGFALMALTTAALATILVREEEEPTIQAERDFERSTRQVLAEISARLDAIERGLTERRPPSPPAAGP
jgi:voltage-gated potassium channel